jgi:hypothetical protein
MGGEFQKARYVSLRGSCALAPANARLLAMAKSRREVIEESRRHGMVAGAATAVTVVLGATAGLPLAAIAAVPTAILGWRWWKHRAENGIRF